MGKGGMHLHCIYNYARLNLLIVKGIVECWNEKRAYGVCNYLECGNRVGLYIMWKTMIIFMIRREHVYR